MILRSSILYNAMFILFFLVVPLVILANNLLHPIVITCASPDNSYTLQITEDVMLITSPGDGSSRPMTAKLYKNPGKKLVGSNTLLWSSHLYKETCATAGFQWSSNSVRVQKGISISDEVSPYRLRIEE